MVVAAVVVVVMVVVVVVVVVVVLVVVLVVVIVLVAVVLRCTELPFQPRFCGSTSAANFGPPSPRVLGVFGFRVWGGSSLVAGSRVHAPVPCGMANGLEASLAAILVFFFFFDFFFVFFRAAILESPLVSDNSGGNSRENCVFFCVCEPLRRLTNPNTEEAGRSKEG